MKKLKLFWESLDGMTDVSKRELFLGLLSCVLTGFVLGIMLCPKKTSIIGSNNGNKGLDGTDLEGQLDD